MQQICISHISMYGRRQIKIDFLRLGKQRNRLHKYVYTEIAFTKAWRAGLNNGTHRNKHTQTHIHLRARNRRARLIKCNSNDKIQNNCLAVFFSTHFTFCCAWLSYVAVAIFCTALCASLVRSFVVFTFPLPLQQQQQYFFRSFFRSFFLFTLLTWLSMFFDFYA